MFIPESTTYSYDDMQFLPFPTPRLDIHVVDILQEHSLLVSHGKYLITNLWDCFICVLRGLYMEYLLDDHGATMGEWLVNKLTTMLSCMKWMKDEEYNFYFI